MGKFVPDAYDRHLSRDLPLLKNCISPEFKNRDWRVETWAPQERFVFAPYPQETLEEIMAAIERSGGEMKVSRLALSVA